MSEQFPACPKCTSKDVTTNAYQVRCRQCDWSIQDPDPRYGAHVAAIGRANITVSEPIAEAIDALPAHFAAALTTTLSRVPESHPAHGAWPGSLTAAEFRLQRERFGLSAEWLSDRLGVALKTVQRWENGHRLIPEGVASEMDIIATAMGEGAARPCAEHLLATEDPVMTIPRTGNYCGFPASWYRALVDQVRDILVNEYGEQGLAAATFRVVYFDEVGDQS